MAPFRSPLRPYVFLRTRMPRFISRQPRRSIQYVPAAQRKPISRAWIKITIRRDSKGYKAFKLLMRFSAIWAGLLFGAFPLCTMALHSYQLDKLVPVPEEFSSNLKSWRRDAWALMEKGAVRNSDQANKGYQLIMRCIAAMENYEDDGEGIQSQPEVVRKYGLLAAGFDVSMKSEEWRREYFTLLLNAAKCCEYMPDACYNYERQGYASWTRTNNPAEPEFQQKDTIDSFISPVNLYRKIITTKGFEDHQRLQALTMLATYYDFTNQPEKAEETFDQAFTLLSSRYPTPPFDRKTLILNDEAGPPSENLLSTLTEYLTLQAQKNRIDIAVPAMLSILRARRNLPNYPLEFPSAPSPNEPQTLWEHILSIFSLPAYPPPPPSGWEIPWRDSAERCKEAKLSILLGEMFFAASKKEEGIVWTREGISSAEMELESLWATSEPTTQVRDATADCRQCLIVGFENWIGMVDGMVASQKTKEARDWADIKQLKNQLDHGQLSWWQKWRRGIKTEEVNKKYDEIRTTMDDRWMLEKQGVLKRMGQDRKFLEETRAPPIGWVSFLTGSV